jgi:hypothetical protein
MSRIEPDTLDQALHALSAFLEADHADPERLVVIGGSALIALGIVSRTTKDMDIKAGVDPGRGLVDARPLPKHYYGRLAKSHKSFNSIPIGSIQDLPIRFRLACRWVFSHASPVATMGHISPSSTPTGSTSSILSFLR